jgi:drug/metabolite transporter (DMT)-like permease
MMAVGIGFVGVVVILRPGTDVFDPNAGLALLAAAMFAVYSVLTRLVARADGSAKPAFFYTGMAGAVAITLIGPFYWTPMTGPDMGWLALLCLTGMSGHYFLIRALDATEAVRIQPFVYLQIVYSVLIGAFVFGETVDAMSLLGMALIVGAGLYAIWREAQAMRRAAASG